MIKSRLKITDTRAPKKLNKEQIKKETQKLKFKLEELQNLMYAEVIESEGALSPRDIDLSGLSSDFSDSENKPEDPEVAREKSEQQIEEELA